MVDFKSRTKTQAKAPSIFDKIASAQAVQRADRIREGAYILAICKVTIEAKFKGTFFIAEMEVVNAKATSDKIAPNAEGSKVGYVLNLDKNLSAMGNVKAFVLALYNETSDVDPSTLAEVIEALVGADQPAKGMLIRASTYNATTMKGEPFMGVSFEGFEQSSEEIKARRDAMGKTPPPF